MLIVSFFALRLVLCTYMAYLFTSDLSRFTSSSDAEWFLVVAQYVIFMSVYSLSWAFVLIEFRPLLGVWWAKCTKRPGQVDPTAPPAAARPTRSRSPSPPPGKPGSKPGHAVPTQGRVRSKDLGRTFPDYGNGA